MRKLGFLREGIKGIEKLICILVMLCFLSTILVPIGLSAIKPAKESDYVYDDLSKHVEITMAVSAWLGSPLPEDDPIRDYIEKKFNITLHYQNIPGGDFINKMGVAFASGKPPDVIFTRRDRSFVLQLWQQGQLMEDCSSVLQYLPTLKQYYETEKILLPWATKNGKLYGIPKYSGGQIWGYWIRKDWLKKLGLSTPRTDEELYKVAYAFTFNDPDGNGKKDTYGFSGGGGGQSFSMLENLSCMYGSPYMSVKGNTIDHPMLNGVRKSFLTYLNRIIKAGLVDPNWYTQKWQEGKSMWLMNKIGIVWYPPELLFETLQANNYDEKVLEWWEPIPPLRGNKGKTGGRYPMTGNVPTGMIAISSKAAKDEVKVKRICHLIDWWMWPNPGMLATWRGLGVPPFKVTKKDLPGGQVYVYMPPDDIRNTQTKYSSLWDWGVVGSYYANWAAGSTPEPDKCGLLQLKYDTLMRKYPTYENIELLMQFDPAVVRRVSTFSGKNEILFALGNRNLTEWDKYVKEWKDAGGEELIKEATEQAKELGLIK